MNIHKLMTYGTSLVYGQATGCASNAFYEMRYTFSVSFVFAANDSHIPDTTEVL